METSTLPPTSHPVIHKIPTFDQDQLYLDAIAASASATGVLPEEYLQDLAATGSYSLLEQLHRFFMENETKGRNNK